VNVASDAIDHQTSHGTRHRLSRRHLLPRCTGRPPPPPHSERVTARIKKLTTLRKSARHHYDLDFGTVW